MPACHHYLQITSILGESTANCVLTQFIRSLIEASYYRPASPRCQLSSKDITPSLAPGETDFFCPAAVAALPVIPEGKVLGQRSPD